MKISYTCNNCGSYIDAIEIDHLDEARFGFDCLTAEERQDLIRFDAAENVIHVQSICDGCIESLGLADDGAPIVTNAILH